MRATSATPIGAERIAQADLAQRPTPMDRTLLEIDLVSAVATNPDVYIAARELPEPEPGSPGRPRHFPNWVAVMHQVLAAVLGSHSKASRVMSHEKYWETIRMAAISFGAPESRPEPPRHHHHTYALQRLDASAEQLARAMRAGARSLALDIGCLRPGAPHSTTAPRRGSFVVGDGKVVASPVRQATVDRWKESGRAIHAHLEAQQGEAATEYVYGSKFALLHTRPDNIRNRRVILDIRPVPHGKGYGGEAAVSLQMIADLVSDHSVSVHGLCYDGALRGKHTSQLLRQGLTVLSPVHGNNKPTGLGQVRCSCGSSHAIVLTDGSPHESIVIDTGEKTLVPCDRRKVYRRRNAGCTFRWYLDYVIKSCGTTHTTRLDTTDDDRVRNFNRSEHLRQHVKTDDGDSVYDRSYGWREDAESCNNSLDRTLYGGRMIAYSATRQFSVMIGYAIGRNAVTRYLHQRDNRH